MTFIDFIKSSPGATPYEVWMYEIIDREAERLGADLASRVTPAELRERTGTPWLIATNEAMASALERDPSGKLASVPALRAWAASPDGIGNTWINWYVLYYTAYLDGKRSPTLAPMMVA